VFAFSEACLLASSVLYNEPYSTIGAVDALTGRLDGHVLLCCPAPAPSPSPLPPRQVLRCLVLLDEAEVAARAGGQGAASPGHVVAEIMVGGRAAAASGAMERVYVYVGGGRRTGKQLL